MGFRKVAMACAIAMMLPVHGTAAASGFAIQQQGGSGLGNAYAGATAGAEDASTIFFNPAGMSQLSGRQLVAAASLISGSSRFTDTGSQPAGGGRALGALPNGSGRMALIPSFFYMAEINPQLRLGVGLNAPFGSKTEYPADWMGRYQAIKSSIETLNLNPSLSWQVNEVLSLGAGINYQHIKATLTNAAVIAGAVDGLTTMEGNDGGWGYNFGGLLKLQDGSRVGIAYRSPIRYKLSGTAYTASSLTVAGVTNTLIAVNADLTVPDSLSFGYFKPLTPEWDVMADMAYTGWSRFKELRVVNAATGATLALTPENWKNTWRIALGASRHIDEKWTARFGFAYDRDPVPEGLRTARIPDSDRTWLSVGGKYRSSKQDTLDFGYAHLFVKSEPVNRNVGGVNEASTAKYGQLTGTFNSSADILSVQYTHGF